jgi:hypothetical protein
MNKLIIVSALLAVTAPALAAEYYIVQNPRTKICTITEERPASGGGLVIGVPFGVRVEAENRMRTVKECTEGPSTTGRGVIEERRDERREERVR